MAIKGVEIYTGIVQNSTVMERLSPFVIIFLITV